MTWKDNSRTATDQPPPSPRRATGAPAYRCGARRRAPAARRRRRVSRHRALGIAARHDRGARRLSLLGRQEVRLFRRHRDDAGAGPVGGHGDRQAGRPEPGRHGLSVARRVLARRSSRASRWSRSGRWAPTTCSTSPSARARRRPSSRTSRARRSCSAAPAGSRSRSDARAGRRRLTKVKYVEAGSRPGARRCSRARATRRCRWEGLRAQWTGPGPRLRLHPRPQLLEVPGQQLRHPQGRLRGRGEEGTLRRPTCAAGRWASSSATSTRARRRRSSWSSSRRSPRR